MCVSVCGGVWECVCGGVCGEGVCGGVCSSAFLFPFMLLSSQFLSFAIFVLRLSCWRCVSNVMQNLDKVPKSQFHMSALGLLTGSLYQWMKTFQGLYVPISVNLFSGAVLVFLLMNACISSLVICLSVEILGLGRGRELRGPLVLPAFT